MSTNGRNVERARNAHATYATFVRPLLPPEAFERAPYRLWYASLQVLLVIGACVLLRITHSSVFYLPVALLAGHSYACMAFFAHELTHGAILKRGPVRRTLEEVLWGFNLIPVALWNAAHNRSHHVETNTLRDPDRRFVENERNLRNMVYGVALYPSRKTFRWNPLVFIQFFGYIARQLVAALGSRSAHLLPSAPKFTPRQRLLVCVEIAIIVSFQFCLCASVRFQLYKYLFIGPIALAFTSSIVMMYVFTNHFLNPIQDETDPITATTSVIVPRWLDLLHCHFSYHTEHHLFPSMNSRYYPLLSKLLSKHYPDKYNRIALSTAWDRLWKSDLFSLAPRAAAPISNRSAATFARTTGLGATHPLISNEINTGAIQEMGQFRVPSIDPRSASQFASAPDAIQFLRQVTVSGGPNPEQFDSLSNCFLKLCEHQVPFAVVREITQPTISTTNCIQGFGFLKPHGYAGDYEMIDRIYTCWVSDDPSLRKWDEYFHSQPAPRAVRNRKAYLHCTLDRLMEEHGTPGLNVLNLGSGPARDVCEYLARPNQVKFECIDLDARAIEYAKCLCKSYRDRVVFRRENVLRVRLEQQFDLIWSGGLFDYFSDRMFVMVLRRLLTHLSPGGELVIGNFSKHNPSRYWMEAVGDWKLHHRSESELRGIAHAVGVDDHRLTVDVEPEGVNLFLHIKGTPLRFQCAAGSPRPD